MTTMQHDVVTAFPTKSADLMCIVHTKIQAGLEAWARLKTHMVWADWVTVGLALAAGRVESMRKARTNEPIGKRYNIEFGRWLEDCGFKDIQPNARSRLLKCIEHLAAIENFLEALPLHERLKLNHPVVVWNRFARELKHPPKPPGNKAPVPDWVKAFYAASPEDRAAGFTHVSLADFLEILSPEHRAELMSRVIKLANNKTGTPDRGISKDMQAVLGHIAIAHDSLVNDSVRQSHQRAALDKLSEVNRKMRAIKRSPHEAAFVWMNTDKNRAA